MDSCASVCRRNYIHYVLSCAPTTQKTMVSIILWYGAAYIEYNAESYSKMFLPYHKEDHTKRKIYSSFGVATTIIGLLLGVVVGYDAKINENQTPLAHFPQ